MGRLTQTEQGDKLRQFTLFAKLPRASLWRRVWTYLTKA